MPEELTKEEQTMFDRIVQNYSVNEQELTPEEYDIAMNLVNKGLITHLTFYAGVDYDSMTEEERLKHAISNTHFIKKAYIHLTGVPNE